ncbi:CYFA0S10e02498g1_1 [Cyberlindnera fabianii]|uniref:CYFA0S10e02498g1_1 n=1 Tax=Cyberlindnera fabianii TaxID=36022 RepID=A0A061B548_CYBFA|nr:Exosome complex component MTR3 [Cyberlindnera fabianii]CDR42806.1 CYFA0S10e02498g1_1 [Cyberlindnera fabianii]
MNTIDRRRLRGPPQAKPLVFAPLPAELQKDSEIDVKVENDIEAQLKRTFIKTGLVTNANGSTYLEVDNNIISVSVYGPRPIRGSFMEKASLSVNLDDVSEVLDSLMEKKFCNYIENNFLSVINLAKYPKSGIDISINVISVQNPEKLHLKLLSLITDATTMALVDAGIELLDIVASGYDHEHNTVVSYVKGNEVVGILSKSTIPLDDLKEILATTEKKAAVVKSALVGLMIDNAQAIQ